jgi:DNA-binding CsgD family transcriptional regulator
LPVRFGAVLYRYLEFLGEATQPEWPRVTSMSPPVQVVDVRHKLIKRRRRIPKWLSGAPSPGWSPLAAQAVPSRQVLALVGRGLSNEEIGARLFLSPVNARTDVSRAMAKLGARDRAQLVVGAYQTGLLSRRP